MIKIVFSLVFCFALHQTLSAQRESKYPTLNQMKASIQKLGKSSNSKVFSIGESEMGTDLLMLQVGEEGNPAVLLVANLAGFLPHTSQAALTMAKHIQEKSNDYTWYFLAMPNPDAYHQFLEGNRYCSLGNGRKLDHDNDRLFAEDAPEDLNGDGFITMMRKIDTGGVYVVDSKERRHMRKAETSKGEIGKYTYYTEGIDNDNDGKYNEDGSTGIVVNQNFSQEFKYFTKENGRYPGDASESFAIMKFVSEHPEIALSISLDKTETLQEFIENKNKSGLDLTKIAPTGRLKGILSLGDKPTYTIDELVAIAKAKYPSENISANDIISFVGTKPEKSLYLSDYNLYATLSKEYNAFLVTEGKAKKRASASAMQAGSFEKWMYHHRGIPMLAKCLYRPELPSKADSTSTELALYSLVDSLDTGFVNWTEFEHKQLGAVEIGGFSEYFWLPEQENAEAIIEPQIQWLEKSTDYLPSIGIASQKATELGKGLVRLELEVKNNGKMSYPLDMGVRNKQMARITIVLDDSKVEFLQGHQRTTIVQLKAQETKKLTWIIKTNGTKHLNLVISAPALHKLHASIEF